MSDRVAIGLDNPIFSGRLRVPKLKDETQSSQSKKYNYTRVDNFYKVQPRTLRQKRVVTNFVYRQPKTISFNEAINSLIKNNIPDRYINRAAVLAIPLNKMPTATYTQEQPLIREKRSFKPSFKKPRFLDSGLLKRYSRVQLGLIALAIIIFSVGLFVSLQTIQTNQATAKKVAALQAQAQNQPQQNDALAPSIVKPTAKQVAAYKVSPLMARYINIPKLGVHAEVMQTGLLASGALGTPYNVYYTDWYNESALPGQPGATLIDGHVSSWTTKGVFYGIHNLVAGDQIQLVRGDGVKLNYTVVKTVKYPANNVDMNAAMQPVVAGVSGLNLITCTGQVEKGTSLFNQRVIVFASLNQN